jgi:hypothetical protein
MNGDAVRVTVQWALWGTGPKPETTENARQDPGYRVLRCSDGVFGKEHFEQVLARYYPGWLDDAYLPQATLFWLPDREQRHYYIAFAIYDPQDRSQYGAADGERVIARCLCVPYAALAAGPVSYWDMFEQFRQMRIPPDLKGVVKTELAVVTSGTEPPPLAMAVAELLLTCQPVAILGAGNLSFADRLRFLDSVLSLLPYGLRTQMSAATLTSSLQEHKFRLFFSEAASVGNYHMVNWSQPDSQRAIQDDPEVSKHLNWLAKMNKLATQTDPVGFHPEEIDKLRGSLFTAPGGPAAGSLADRWVVPAGQAMEQSVVELLEECAEMLGSSSEFKAAADKLSLYAYSQMTPVQRQRYQEIVKDRQLLRQRLPVRNEERTKFYKTILGLAFGIPLTYTGYCQLEDCLGDEPERRLPKYLLLAVSGAEIEDFCLRLLILKANGDDDLDDALDYEIPAAQLTSLLVGTAADDKLRVDHGKIVYRIVIRHFERSEHRDEQLLRKELGRWGYLAPTLQRLYPADFKIQTTELSRLLEWAYADGLDRPAIQQIFGSAGLGPTLALCTVVSTMARPEDAWPIEQAFSGLASRMRMNVLRQFGQDAPPEPDDDEPQPGQNRSAVTRLLRVRRK